MQLAAWTPEASVDWRFLPEMPSNGKALLVTPTKATMAVGLLAAFAQVVVITEEKTAVFPPELSGNGRLVIQNEQHTQAAPFDLLALPLGFTQPPAAQLAWARALLKKEGVLYLGIANRLSYRRWQGRQSVAITHATLYQAQTWLSQAGFASVTAYGLLPNAAQPQTIFPLTPDAISLALARSWRKMDKAHIQAWTAKTAVAKTIRQILPSYGLVAKLSAPK